MAKRKRKPTKKFPIRWEPAVGDPVEYVDRTASELPVELERVRSHGLRAAKVLSRLSRVRHIVLISARFELSHCHREVPEDVTSEWYANEIARLSYVYQQTLDLLERLCHSRTKWIEEARFLLRYGQTPTKREPAGNYGSKNKG